MLCAALLNQRFGLGVKSSVPEDTDPLAVRLSEPLLTRNG